MSGIIERMNQLIRMHGTPLHDFVSLHPDYRLTTGK